jgi:hypothetical protein
MLGGLHVLDPGPAWRMLCGLYTGHIAILWLIFSTQSCRALLRPSPATPLWSRRNLAQLYIAPMLLALLAILFPHISTGYYLWITLASLGIALLLLATLNTLRTLTLTLWHLPSPRPHA